MVEKIWFERHFFYYLLWPLLWPLSKIFAVISQRRRKAYQQGKKPSYRAPVPVIVVGNITAGGNGKTPVVVWLVEKLVAEGFHPAVVSRGYGAKAPYYPFIVQSDSSSEQVGDEPLLIKQRTGVPIAVAPVRADAVKALLAENSTIDIIITDDGLQHYALQRDIEFVVIDGKRRFGNQQFIPLGPLRESLHRLDEVDFLIRNGETDINKFNSISDSEIEMRLAPNQLVNIKTGEKRMPDKFSNCSAIAGIGHPPRFFNTLNELGISLVYQQGFADHQQFDKQELASIAAKGRFLLMTEKDAVKCREIAQDNWWYLPVSAEISSEKEAIIITRIKEVKKDYGSSST
ncbi:tetraacyldisaccharide 4'-kinase [Vibrio sp. SS-MA-C1-2]|uniref:tetraacyldisaccharide 4'-kinase n=1 Tax=Vibrio sp. SS-MA-C1-2 TaxID=2908646 RepID=UPI001F39ECA1|nr:tetraacyldisaccharide 4'-kinase [Vibrio sp. SS-MA-C1-2]UJF17388.1 tetraacyldisaccharide 4'-kinase [Vibrio sp. SS-MA-C1-2]